jgi:hypothetical protein
MDLTLLSRFDPGAAGAPEGVMAYLVRRHDLTGACQSTRAPVKVNASTASLSSHVQDGMSRAIINLRAPGQGCGCAFV